MKKIIIVVLAGFIASNSYAKNEVLSFNETVHNFGNIPQMTRVSTVFYYTNKSDQVITIKKVHSSCGCTVPEISKKILQPNEFGKITVTFNSGQYSGTVGKTVRFEIEPNIANVFPMLMIRATVQPDVYLQPPSIFIPKIDKNRIITNETKILSSNFTNFSILNVNYTKEYVTVDLQKMKPTNNTYGYIMKITLNVKDYKEKYVNETVYIKTSINSTPNLNFNIHGYLK